MWCMWSKVGIGGEHHRYYKHTQVSSKSERWPKIPCWFDTEWPRCVVSQQCRLIHIPDRSAFHQPSLQLCYHSWEVSMTGLLPTGFTYFEAICGYCDQSLHRTIKDMQDLTHSSLCIITCNCDYNSHVFYLLLVDSGNCCVLLSSFCCYHIFHLLG